MLRALRQRIGNTIWKPIHNFSRRPPAGGLANNSRASRLFRRIEQPFAEINPVVRLLTASRAIYNLNKERRAERSDRPSIAYRGRDFWPRLLSRGAMKRVKTEYPTVGSREPRRFRTQVCLLWRAHCDAQPVRMLGSIGWYYPRSCARSFSGHTVGTSLKIIIARCSMQSRLGAKLEFWRVPSAAIRWFRFNSGRQAALVWFGATAERPFPPHVKFGKVRRTGTCREKQGVHYRACDCAHRRPIFGAGRLRRKHFASPLVASSSHGGTAHDAASGEIGGSSLHPGRISIVGHPTRSAACAGRRAFVRCFAAAL